MTLRRAIASSLVLSAAACAHNPPPGPVTPISAPIAFAATTPSDSIMRGSFEGTAVIHDSWIDVTLSRIDLDFPEGPADRWRSLTIRGFLAANYGRGEWSAPVESRPTNLWRYLEFPRQPLTGRTPITVADSLHFTVPIPPGTALDRARIAIELEWVTLYHEAGAEYGETESALAFSRAPLTVTSSRGGPRR